MRRSYVFCFVGLIAVVLVIINAMQKKPIYLGTSLLAVALSLLFAGGPLDETGHYIWECRNPDAEGVRCGAFPPRRLVRFAVCWW